MLVPNNPEVSEYAEVYDAPENYPGEQQAMRNSLKLQDNNSNYEDEPDYGDYGESYDVVDSEVVANRNLEAGQIEEAKEMPYGYKILQQRSNM